MIQARMASSRLPGKVMLTLLDRPVIQWVYERATRTPGVDHAVVATTTTAADDALAAWCERHGIAVFRGSEHDVLDRYVQCARSEQADVVVRLTADCPLLDPLVSGQVLAAFMNAQPACDFASNDRPVTFPDGLDTEVIAREALEVSAREASDAFEREHVTGFIRANAERFRLESVVGDVDLSEHRWTLDELRDFAFLYAVAQRLRARGIRGSLQEVLAILDAEPQLRTLNSGIVRNAGSRRVD